MEICFKGSNLTEENIMNYIKQLQAENAELKAQAATAQNAINDFRAYLMSSKFTGLDLDGSNKDYIHTHEVLSAMIVLRDHLQS